MASKTYKVVMTLGTETLPEGNAKIVATYVGKTLGMSRVNVEVLHQAIQVKITGVRNLVLAVKEFAQTFEMIPLGCNVTGVTLKSLTASEE